MADGDGGGESERYTHNVSKCVIVGTDERGAPMEELLEEHAVDPLNHDDAMLAPAYHLRGHILMCADK